VTAGSPRERYREQLREEIKQHAWEQLGRTGPSAISLNAIAKQMQLSGPALYRYYGSRDELITELILDAYHELAAALRTAADGGTPRGQLTAMADALRQWAIREPNRYLLLYGTPVPGYHAPAASTEIAASMMAGLLAAFAALSPAAGGAAERRALLFWTRLHGVLSLELAGHFTGMGFDPAELYAAEVADLIGPRDA
jgi:AcrR family transcriptional regulator